LPKIKGRDINESCELKKKAIPHVTEQATLTNNAGVKYAALFEYTQESANEEMDRNCNTINPLVPTALNCR